MTNTKLKNATILFVAFAFMLAFIFRDALAAMMQSWQKDEYSHGVIIPFISLLLAWHAMAAAHPVARPSWWGVALLMASAVFLIVGTLAAFEMASEYGFILALVALSLAFLGRQAAWAMLP